VKEHPLIKKISPFMQKPIGKPQIHQPSIAQRPAKELDERWDFRDSVLFCSIGTDDRAAFEGEKHPTEK